jgi:hypothetical protein
MDVGAFVQENKRWLLGCAIGTVVFFVAKAVIGSVYDPDVPRRSAQKSAQVGQVYDRTALQAATTEQAELQAARRQLQQELTYVQDAAYQLEGKAMTPDEYLGKIGRDRKREILRAANEREVLVADKDLQWPPAPQGVDEIRAVLFGIELVEALSQRLFAAHDQARRADPQATGLVAFGCKVEPRRQQRTAQRPNKAGEVDVREFLEQQRVTFDFKSDEATAQAFLESLRQPGKTLVLDVPLKMTRTERRNDPVAVTGAVVGIAFKDK